jgi:hypothetical protein
VQDILSRERLGLGTLDILQKRSGIGIGRGAEVRLDNEELTGVLHAVCGLLGHPRCRVLHRRRHTLKEIAERVAGGLHRCHRAAEGSRIEGEHGSANHATSQLLADMYRRELGFTRHSHGSHESLVLKNQVAGEWKEIGVTLPRPTPRRAV